MVFFALVEYVCLSQLPVALKTTYKLGKLLAIEIYFAHNFEGCDIQGKGFWWENSCHFHSMAEASIQQEVIQATERKSRQTETMFWDT